MKIYFTFDSKENKLKIIICYCMVNNLNLKFFIFLHHIIFFLFTSFYHEQLMNNLIPSYNSLHLSLIIHLISMIFMNLKITISYIKIYNFKVQKYQSYFYYNISYKI